MHRHATHRPADYDRAFAFGVALNGAFVVAEAGAGLMLGALALLADAGHNLGDVASLALAWGAGRLARLQATSRRTYGYRKVTVLAALGSGLLLVAALGGIAWEAVQRLGQPSAPDGLAVAAVAAVGVAVNLCSALLFRRAQGADLNVRGAYLHLLADAAVSGGVVVSGVLLRVTGWAWLDPAVTLAIVGVVLVGAWGLLREAARLSIDAVPRHLDTGSIERYLAGHPAVAGVHDLHVWGLSTTEAALTAHLVVPRGGDEDALLQSVRRQLQLRFGIGHATLQIERGDPDHPCEPGC